MIIVYTKNNCPFCEQTKYFLDNKKVSYSIVNIDDDANAKQFVIDQGHRTVPQIYNDDTLIVEGGYNGLVKLTEDQLKEKLNVAE